MRGKKKTEEPTSELISWAEERKGPGRGVGRKELSISGGVQRQPQQACLDQHLDSETKTFACF